MTRPATGIVWSGTEHSLSPEVMATAEQAEQLLDIAELAIRARLDGTQHPGPDVHQLPQHMQQPCGAFVTLHISRQLNGCIGNIDASDPIGACVARLAVQAAFEDARFPPLTSADLDVLHIEVSLLSPHAEVPAASRAQLIEQLTPGVDGLIVASGHHRAVFLPAVWDQLPDPEQFLDQLLRKAGLPTTTWPSDMHAELFTTESFGRQLR